MLRLVAVAAAILATGAAFSQTIEEQMQAREIANILASEEPCKLSYNQSAIQKLIDAKLKASDINSPVMIPYYTNATAMKIEKISPSQLTAHCVQMKRVSEHYGLLAG